ncbi:hypothetical protein ABZV14_40580 [Streptosporangium canum]|uniref:hypothetical protein n=1 Tax=Streptosporangium canum TaxID=324952 RepID=UPI0033B41BFA
MTETGERIVAWARESGDIRPDATALTAAAASLREHLSADAADRLIALPLGGLARR